MIVILLAALACGAWATYVEPYRRERQLELLVTQLGGRVATDSDGRLWLQEILGRGSTNAVIAISLCPVEFANEWNEWEGQPLPADVFKRIGAARRLFTLDLRRCQVTDNDLVRLRRLSSLVRLDLAYNPITDAGVRHLTGLTDLRSLRLQSTSVTDESLVALSELPQLRLLILDGTGVTSAGIEAFRLRSPRTKIVCLQVYFVRILPNQKPSWRNFDGRRFQCELAEFKVINLGDEEVSFGTDSRNRLQGALLQLTKNRFCLFRTNVSDGKSEVNPRRHVTFFMEIPLGTNDATPLRCGPWVSDISGLEFADEHYVLSDPLNLPAH